jgi:hypothetical protein
MIEPLPSDTDYAVTARLAPLGFYFAARLSMPLRIGDVEVEVPADALGLFPDAAGEAPAADERKRSVFEDVRSAPSFEIARIICLHMRCAAETLETTAKALGFVLTPIKSERESAAPAGRHFAPEPQMITPKIVAVGEHSLLVDDRYEVRSEGASHYVVETKRNLIQSWHASRDAALAWAVEKCTGRPWSDMTPGRFTWAAPAPRGPVRQFKLLRAPDAAPPAPPPPSSPHEPGPAAAPVPPTILPSHIPPAHEPSPRAAKPQPLARADNRKFVPPAPSRVVNDALIEIVDGKIEIRGSADLKRKIFTGIRLMPVDGSMELARAPTLEIARKMAREYLEKGGFFHE